MSEISVEAGAIITAMRACLEAQKALSAESSSLARKCADLAPLWRDDKLREFERMLQDCVNDLRRPVADLQRGQVFLQKLLDSVREYESVSFGGGSSTAPETSASMSTENSGISNGAASTAAAGSTTEHGTPHFYETTQETWHPGRGYQTVRYDSPVETGRRLNSNQGVPASEGGEGVAGFQGTCGLVSCENILRMAGLTITEADVVNYARRTRANGALFRRLCTVHRFACNNGGTYATDRQQILQHFGVESMIESGGVHEIARRVEEGHGVIATVNADVLWRGAHRNRRGQITNSQMPHAIVITSVERDSSSGALLGFYICDSGTHGTDESRYVEAFDMADALMGHYNVTTRVIR